MIKTLPWAANDATSGKARPANPLLVAALHLAARLLRSASDALDHVAERVSTPERAMDIGAGVVEFHALYREGAAPEGALYVNGRLVAILPEVPRL
jgi:hypothetical protein